MVPDPKVLQQKREIRQALIMNIEMTPQLTIPRRRRGQESGRESKVCRSVKPAFVVHITC